MLERAASLAVVVCLAACSSNSSAASSPSPTPLTAAQYVAGFCTAITKFQIDVQQQQASFNSSTTDLTQLKQSWIDFLNGMIQSTKTLVSDVEALGVPATSDGQTAAATFKSDFETLEQDLQQLADQSQSLSPTSPGDFMSSFQPMTNKFQTDLKGFGEDLQKLNGGPLDQAFKQAPECASLQGSASPSP
jgi:hypothetical protein